MHFTFNIYFQVLGMPLGKEMWSIALRDSPKLFLVSRMEFKKRLSPQLFYFPCCLKNGIYCCCIFVCLAWEGTPLQMFVDGKGTPFVIKWEGSPLHIRLIVTGCSCSIICYYVLVNIFISRPDIYRLVEPVSTRTDFEHFDIFHLLMFFEGVSMLHIDKKDMASVLVC